MGGRIAIARVIRGEDSNFPVCILVRSSLMRCLLRLELPILTHRKRVDDRWLYGVKSFKMGGNVHFSGKVPLYPGLEGVCSSVL